MDWFKIIALRMIERRRSNQSVGAGAPLNQRFYSGQIDTIGFNGVIEQ
jgi:hypothetical protein